MPAVRNGNWDGKIRLFNSSTGVIRYGLIPQVCQFLDKLKYSYDIIDKESFAANNLSDVEAQEFIKSLELPSKYQIRDYQLSSFVRGARDRRMISVVATSGGKSLMQYLWYKWFDAPTLLIVPDIGLVKQMEGDFLEYGCDSDDIHLIYADGDGKNVTKPLAISTWQSIYKLPESWFSRYKLTLGDEVHGFKADSLQKIMDKLTRCPNRIGVTGTLEDSKIHHWILEGMFGPIVETVKVHELVERKLAAKPLIKGITLIHPKSVAKTIHYARDYHKELDYLVTNKKRNRFITNLALSLKGNSVILFRYVDKQGIPLYNELKKLKDNVYIVYQEVDADERQVIRSTLEKYDNCDVVASYRTFATGTNIVRLDNIIFASPTKSKVRLMQSVGRALRRSEQKTSCNIYDIGDDLSYNGEDNTTLKHYVERIQMYAKAKLKYQLYTVNL